jgi:chromosome condensin MukBEF ATPase and DNA-binding subunit MukB
MSPTDANNTATREDINRLSDKIDGFYTIFLTKTEYTNAHSNLINLVSALTAQVTTLSAQVDKNREITDRAKEDNNRYILVTDRAKEDNNRYIMSKIDVADERLGQKIDEQNKDSKTEKAASITAKQWLVGLLYSTASSVTVGLIIVVVAHFWH